MATNPKIVIFVTSSGQSPRLLVCSNLSIWGFFETLDKCLGTLVSIFAKIFSLRPLLAPQKWPRAQNLWFLWHRPVKAPGLWFVQIWMSCSSLYVCSFILHLPKLQQLTKNWSWDQCDEHVTISAKQQKETGQTSYYRWPLFRRFHDHYDLAWCLGTIG